MSCLWLCPQDQLCPRNFSKLAICNSSKDEDGGNLRNDEKLLALFSTKFQCNLQRGKPRETSAEAQSKEMMKNLDLVLLSLLYL